MKYEETQIIPASGRNPQTTWKRVIEADEAPEGAVVVPDKTPVSDWEEVN
jgi:hypothetical protein